MTSGSLPVWLASVMLLLAPLLPMILMVMAFRWLRRARARRRASRQAVKATAPVSNASATAQGQSQAPAGSPQPDSPQSGSPETPPAAPPKDPLWESVLGAVIAGIVLIRIGMAVVWWFTPDFRVLPPSMPNLESRLQEYVDIKGLKENLETKTVTGKVVVVDKDKASLHPLMRGLPGSIRATSPEEVDFVIWIDSERVPDPDHQVYASRKLTPQEMANWRAGSPTGSGMSRQPTATVTPYKAKWTATVIDLKKKEIKSTRSFTGPSLPSGELDFRPLWFSGQYRLYVDDKMIKGAEVIFGGKADVGDILVGGKRLAGVVGPVPWDETLEWIGQSIKP